MTTATEPALTLNGLEIENFLSIKVGYYDVNGRHMIVSGRNSAGKSSIGAAIWTAILGVSAKQFPEPIHRGEDWARIKLDLGDLKIDRTITHDGSDRLTVNRRDGSKVQGSPQKFLDSLISAICLDPGKFLAKRPQDQVDDVLRLCRVAPPVESVQRVTGEVIQPLKDESAAAYLNRLSADHSGLYYVRRLEKGRECDQKARALDEQREVVRQLGGPVNGDVDSSAPGLVTRIEALNAKADQRRAALARADEATVERDRLAGQLQALKREQELSAARIMRIEEQIEALQLKRKEEGEKLAALMERVGNGVRIVQEAADEAVALSQEAAAMLDPSAEIAQLTGEVRAIERAADQRSKRRHACDQQERLSQELEFARQDHKALDDIVNELRHVRRHLLDGVSIGVDGLEIGDGDVRLNGVPLQQAGHAEQMELALSLAMHAQPHLKLIFLDDAEHMDAERREHIIGRAEVNGYRVVMMVVSDASDLTVEFVDVANTDRAAAARKRLVS